MKHLLILSTMWLTACAKPSNDFSAAAPGIDAEFNPYVELYVKIKGGGFGYEIPIHFGDLDGNKIGLCVRWSNGARAITISRSYWSKSTTSEREKISLIFHELGHCDLNRDHVSAVNSDGWPKSFMYPYNYGYRERDRDYYFSELFNPNLSFTAATLASEDNGDCVEDLDVDL